MNTDIAGALVAPKNRTIFHQGTKALFSFGERTNRLSRTGVLSTTDLRHIVATMVD